MPMWFWKYYSMSETLPWALLVSMGAKKIETRSWRNGISRPIGDLCGQELRKTVSRCPRLERSKSDTWIGGGPSPARGRCVGCLIGSIASRCNRRFVFLECSKGIRAGHATRMRVRRLFCGSLRMDSRTCYSAAEANYREKFAVVLRMGWAAAHGSAEVMSTKAMKAAKRLFQ